jgi:GNAT superfamily N-acetyltransferase
MHPIRELRDDDSDALIELIRSCWAAYPTIVMDVDGELPHLRAPASAYAGLGGRAWAVDGGDGLVGSVAVVPGDPGTAELRMLYVLATERRGGLGRRLLETAELAAAESGATRMELWSDTRFTDAHRFYGRNGYTRTGASRTLDDLSATVEWHFAKLLGG